MVIVALKLTLVIEEALDVDSEWHWVDTGASTLPVSVMRMVGILEPMRLPVMSEGTMDSGRLVVVAGELEDAVVRPVSTRSHAHPTLASDW